MFLDAPDGKNPVLSDEEKASAINLALFLEVADYDKTLLKRISKFYGEEFKIKLYEFWKNLTPATHRAWLSMAKFEEKI